MTVRFGPFTFDQASRRVTCQDCEIHLTPKAFDLLGLLIAQHPRVVPKAELHACLWPDAFVSDATLAGVIKELRRALRQHDAGDGPPEAPIRVVRRVGVALGIPVARPSTRARPVQHWLAAGDRKFPLYEGENIIGRGGASTIVLDSPTVSRMHACVRITEMGAFLEDLGSKNGTTLGSAAVTTPTPLIDGAVARVGAVTLVYRSEADALSTMTLSSGGRRSVSSWARGARAR